MSWGEVEEASLSDFARIFDCSWGQPSTKFDQTHEVGLCNDWAYLEHIHCSNKEIASADLVPKLFNLMWKEGKPL
jgi:hypothetical protein